MVILFVDIEGREEGESKVVFKLRWIYDVFIGEEF